MSIALVRNPGDGEELRYYHKVMEQVATNAETGGAVTVLRITLNPEDAPPLHSHSREDESWVILSGRVRFWVGATSLDECEVYDAEPGAYVHVSRHIPHTFQTLTPGSEVLVINNPGAIEGYFRSIGPADAREDGKHTDLSAEYGITNFDNPPPA